MLPLNSSSCKSHHGDIVDVIGRAVAIDSSYLHNPHESVIGLNDTSTEPTYSTRLKLEQKHLGRKGLEYKFDDNHIILLLNVKCYVSSVFCLKSRIIVLHDSFSYEFI
jgi:hypothetical protein